MYNPADDLSSPFMTSGRTITHEEVVNGPNSTRSQLGPGSTPPDTRMPISPPKNPNPDPGDLSNIGVAPPVDPNVPTGDPSTPSTPGDKPNDPIDRLIDLIGAQIAGGGTLGGTVALPTSTTSSSNGAANAFILIAIVGVLGYLGWKAFHKGAA